MGQFIRAEIRYKGQEVEVFCRALSEDQLVKGNVVLSVCEDFVFVQGGITADLGAPASSVRTGASILSAETLKTSADHPALAPVLFRNGVLYDQSPGGNLSSYTHTTAPASDGQWGLAQNGADVDLKIFEQTASDFDGDDWFVAFVPVD